MKNKILLLLLLLLLSLGTRAENYQLPGPTKDQFIYFNADDVTYDKQQNVAALKGNVEITLDDNITKRIVKGQNVQIFIKEQLLVSEGTTIIEDEKGIFTGDDITFDLVSRSLVMKNVTADYSPIRVLSTKSTEVENGHYILRDATLTCCNLEKPHYTLYVGKADLEPGKRIFATNAIIKIGKVPVFYLPFIYRSLNTGRILTTNLDFDQSNNTGFGFLTSTVLSLNNFRAKANLDYYTKSGIGYGGEVAYDDPQKFRGSLQAYTIYDKVLDKQRWGIDGGYWWQVYDSSDSLNKGTGAIYFSQLETRNVSDADFNDDFFRSNPYVVSPDKLTKVSAVRQSSNSTFRVSYSNRRELNPDDKTYSNAEEYAPKVDLIFNPFVIGKTGLVNNLAFSLNNRKIEDYDSVQYLHGRWTTAKDVKLHRNFTLTPTLFYDQEAILADPTNNNEDSFVGRYGGQLNLRSDLLTGMLDMGYRYTRRTASGSLTSQTKDEFDGGEEENMFYVQNYYLPTPNFYFKLATGYDIRSSTESWDFKYRMEPLTAEAGYFSPYTGTNFFAQNLYDVNTGNQAFILDSTFRNINGSYANLGIANYSTDRSTFLVTTKFLITPKNFSWRADMGIDFEVGGGALRPYSKHIKIYKDFHDIMLMVGVRDRNQNLSFTFRINVLCGATQKTESDKRIDEYWYPWRDNDMIRDNF